MRKLETPSPEIADGADIATIIAGHAREHGLRAAVIDGARSVNWSEHGARIHRVANALIGLGIAKGDRVAMFGRNSIEYQEAFLGTLLAGECAVPLPTMASSDATDEMLWRDEEGMLFFKTGDIGRLDEDGFLYLSDRKKDVIISGGFNIFATDLEIVLLKHEAVREAAVIGIPSQQWGETPLALVVLEQGAAIEAEALRQWANERLGKAQRIAELELRDDLPKSDIGKVLKRELRAPYFGRSVDW